MKKDTLNAINDILKKQDEARVHLDKQAKVVEAIDRRLSYVEKQKSELEKLKQLELEKMQDLFDAAVTNKHVLHNGYTIKAQGKRPMSVKDPELFLRWLKKNFEPKVVAEFFADALKTQAIKDFVMKYCDEERLKGNIKPSVDGVDIEAINYRRLTTILPGEKKK